MNNVLTSKNNSCLKILISILLYILYIHYKNHYIKKEQLQIQNNYDLKLIHKIRQFKINEIKFLFFDIFYKDNKIYIISPIYNKPYNEKDIIIKINSKQLQLFDKIVKDKYEPTLIFIYKYESFHNKINVSIEYQNTIKFFDLYKINNFNQNNLTITTLFKNDYKLFSIFYDYYTKQGVDSFYMYYNGIINDNIKKTINLKNVTLIEWNFNYWNPPNFKYKHHAQLGQIHHAIYKYGKNINKYMIFCDLDEYMYIPGTTIKNYIYNHPDIDIFGFCNHWSKTINSDIIPESFPNKFLISNKLNYKDRSKNIYKLDSIKSINIHFSNFFTILNPKLISNLNMYHFFNWSNYNNHRKDTINYINTISTIHITVKNASNEELNGIYIYKKLNNIDKNTLSFYKDEKYQIYRYNGIWVIAHQNNKIYKYLEECRNKEWDIEILDFSNNFKQNQINDIHILPPIINKQQHSITYNYLYDGEKYKFTNTYLSKIDIYNGIEGLICIFVPHCILTGKTINSNISVDKIFLDNIQNIVSIFKKWHNNNNLKLNINVPIKEKNLQIKKKKTISTFTMGVDSFYTLYSNFNKIDIILFVIGFDITKHQKNLLQKTVINLKKISKMYNKELIICDSTLRNNINHGNGFQWGEYFHGPALFNIIYGLSNEINTLYLPSSHTPSYNHIWGSTHLTDKKYSSSFFKIMNNGDLTRVEKIKFILNYDIKCLDFLRVCWKNKDEKYNCTMCEKCLRTFYTIELLGYKNKAVTFDRNIDGKNYWNFKPRNKSDESFQKEIKKLENMLINNKYNEIEDISNFLIRYKNKEIIYIPNPGNAGDSLIAYGTLQLFNKIGLNYKIGNINEKYFNKILFYGGGGNLVGIYDRCKKFINNNKNSNEIVLLPHTVKDEDELISNLDKNIIIICREKTSYNYVYTKLKYKKNVYLSKDLALYISEIEKYKNIKGVGECNCFRTCKHESTNIIIPENNIDLSFYFQKKNNTSDTNIIKDISLSIFNYLSKFDTINTNRLHMAISGSLLNKNVNFFPNSYYKNKSVSEYSLKPKYYKTIFHNPAKILLVILSCYKEKNKWSSYINSSSKFNIIIICGKKMNQNYKLENNILYLNCNDYYEGLPEKMIACFDSILNIDKFNDITHIIKIDGHDNNFNKIENVINNPEIYKNHYLGQRINYKNNSNNRRWHFNKVSKKSYWDNKEYDGDYIDWIDGGTSYILSRKALILMNSIYSFKNLYEVSKKHIYEDLMIAKLLKQFNILPKKIYYNINGDKNI